MSLDFADLITSFLLGLSVGLGIGAVCVFLPEIINQVEIWLNRKESAKYAYCKRRKIIPEYDNRGHIINAYGKGRPESQRKDTPLPDMREW